MWPTSEKQSTRWACGEFKVAATFGHPSRCSASRPGRPARSGSRGCPSPGIAWICWGVNHSPA
ncbi:hypothetical protein ACFFX0_07280 [Citricoccus parietis]|uniref:Uncharacterized protein n=1 Tax=Citricoccus parietis TaxID=592307 RepID=A0ABV5FWK3_9MICC